MARDVLAIIGSTRWPEPELLQQARRLIQDVLTARRPDLIVSGGAAGIDALAKVIGDEWGIPVVEHLPQNRRWRPAGFEERNWLIVRDCTRLLCIRSKASRTYGSGWTADRAEEMGRAVWRVML